MIEIALGNGVCTLIDDEDANLTSVAWHRHSEGYAKRDQWRDGHRRNIYLHREILGLSNASHVIQVDHINGDRLDNRRANLRRVTNQENSQNTSARSGYRGVYFATACGRWMARCKVNYKHQFLGRYATEIEAARAAEAFRRMHLPLAVPDHSLDPVPPCPCRACSTPWEHKAA